MAERAGFEPARQLPTYTLSKRAPSATRTPLHPRLSDGDQACLNPGKYCYWEMTLHTKTEGARFELA